VFDFKGSGPEVRGNLNAPISVVHSAVIYCLRSMLNMDIPLNSGCLVPITSTSTRHLSESQLTSVDSVNIPQDSLLSPSDTAAVCAGNVLTSQRIVDVVLKAFDACAASQGCTKYVVDPPRLWLTLIAYQQLDIRCRRKRRLWGCQSRLGLL
jgi:5-oxoprolinase (ATP-hydrolysing)